MIERQAPGFAEALRAEAIRHTPMGILTRGVSGIAGRCLIVNFPGNPKAIGELAQREARAPTVSELAAHLQMTEEEVLEGLESANAYSTVSLDAPDSGDEDAPAVADSLAARCPLANARRTSSFFASSRIAASWSGAA